MKRILPATTRPDAAAGPGWRRLRGVAATLLLLGLALAVYLPRLSPLPVMDDGSVYLENPASKEGGDWLTAPYFADTFRSLWRPVAQLSFRWNTTLWGAERLPAAVVNVVLLAASAALVGLWLRQIGLRRWTAVAASAVLLVQPVASESVARLAGRSELLALVFILAAMNLHAFWAARTERHRPVATVSAMVWGAWGLLLLLALLSKEIALVLPVLALAFEGTRTSERARIARRSRMIGVVLAALVVTVAWASLREGVLRGWPHEMKRNPAPDYIHALTDSERVRFALALPVHYAGMLAGTEALLPDYAHLVAWPTEAPPIELGNPGSFGVGLPSWPRAVAGVLLLGAFAAAYWWLRKRWPVMALGAGWFCITLLAVLPLCMSYGNVASTRALLLPVIGLVMIGAFAFDLLWDGPGGRRARIVAGGLALMIAVVSLARTRAALEPWASQERLMTYLAEQAPESPEVPLYHGLLAMRTGQLDQAVGSMEASAALFPRNPRVLLNLSILYKAQGRSSLAGRAMSDAVAVAGRLMPGTAVEAQAHLVLGAFLGEQDQEEAALHHYLKAVEADSLNFHALARAGALEALHYATARQGIAHIRRALELDRAGALGPLAAHIRDTAERAERYLRLLDGNEQGFQQAMEPRDENLRGERDQ